MSDLHLTVYLRRIVFALTVIVSALMISVPSSRGAETQAPEEWIFSVVMPPKWLITDTIFAYQLKGGYYLPIVELAEGFEFYIEAEIDRAYVSGFAGHEDNSFTIDGERDEMIINGERETLPAGAILEDDSSFQGDLYVRMDVLNDIWPVEMMVSLSDITILVEAEEELSFERRLKREERKTIFESREAQKQVDTFLPYVDNNYQWLGKPALNIQSNYTYDKSDRLLTGTNTITGTQQIAHFIADYNANYKFDDGKLRRPDSIRMRLSRQAPEGEDLFIPTLKFVQAGDVSLGLGGLIGSNIGGRGVIISNNETGGRREFDRITVEGRGPPGWEIELYNNNRLERIGAVQEDGDYRFEDIVLNYGNNRIRVILYGPQGQVREIVDEYDVSGGLLSPGEFKYNAGIVDQERSFIQLEPYVKTGLPQITNAAEFSYGLNNWMTLFGGYTRTPAVNRNEDARFYTGGAGINTPIGFVEIEGYKRINGGSAVDTRFVTELLGISLNMRGAVYSKFLSTEAGLSQDTAKRLDTELQARRDINFLSLPINFVLDVQHREFYDNRVTTTVGTTQTFTGGGLRFNHNTNTRFVGEDHISSSGGFGVNWSAGNWQTRSGLSYSMHPVFDLTNANAEVRYRNPEGLQSALNFTHSFGNSITSYGAQLGYDFGDILTSVDARYVREQGWRFGVRASTSLTPYTPNKIYNLSSSSKQSRAAVRGRIFLDRDSDGTFSEGDEPLEGVRLKLGRSRSQEVSDKDGYIVSFLRPDVVDNISIDTDSLEDPYYALGIEGYSTLGLRGSMPSFEFPIVETGAIDGTVTRDPSGTEVSGMRIQLVKPDGEIYMTTETAFDGYYAFEFVLPGEYIVRADPEYRVNVPAETVTVSSEEIFAFGIDLYLLEPVAEESAAEQAGGEGGGIAQLPTTAPAVSGTSQPAPVSPQDEGSSQIPGESSDEVRPPTEMSADDEGSSFIDQSESSEGAALFGISSVSDVRIGERPDEVRLVLDLSGPASYVIEEGKGLIVMIDMPGTTWDTTENFEFKYSRVLESYAIELLPGKGTRLLLKAVEAMKVKDHKLLPASEDKLDRLIIDLEKR